MCSMMAASFATQSGRVLTTGKAFVDFQVQETSDSMLL